jgi:hypothetical protein
MPGQPAVLRDDGPLGLMMWLRLSGSAIFHQGQDD